MQEAHTDARFTIDGQATAFEDVFRNAADHPRHVAVRKSDGGGGWDPVTCAELADQVAAVAAGLLEADIGHGDRVAVMSRTRYEWMVADFAILSVGAITVPIYETSSDSQIEWILSDSGAVAVFVEDAVHAERVKGLRARLPELTVVWTFDDDLPRLIREGAQHDEEAQLERRRQVQSADVATIVYTSGTTGRPKGCMLTHANLVSTVRNIAAAPGVHELIFNDEQSTLLFLPLAHILARIIQCSAVHQRVTLGHLADVHELRDALASYQPTVVLSVPRVFEKVYHGAQRQSRSGLKHRIFEFAEHTAVAYSEAMDRPGGPGLALRAEHALLDELVGSKLRAAMGGKVRWAVSGGAPLGATLGHFFRGTGVNVLEGYGLTETTAGGTLNLPGAQRVGSVGRPIPGCTIRIAADGEILMKGPHIFLGYWRNPAATGEVLDSDGWFHTGDIGLIDDDGFVTITDRKKDIIVTAAGKNVAPTVLEDGLRAHWLISQAAVFGDRRPYVAALLTLDPEALVMWKQDHGLPLDLDGHDLTNDAALIAELQRAVDAANSAVSQAEAIKRWRVLPRDFSEAAGELTPTMKLRRHVVEAEFAPEVAALYDGAVVSS